MAGEELGEAWLIDEADEVKDAPEALKAEDTCEVAAEDAALADDRPTEVMVRETEDWPRGRARPMAASQRSDRIYFAMFESREKK